MSLNLSTLSAMFKNNIYTSSSPTPKLMKSSLMLLGAQVLTVEVI